MNRWRAHAGIDINTLTGRRVATQRLRSKGNRYFSTSKQFPGVCEKRWGAARVPKENCLPALEHSLANQVHQRPESATRVNRIEHDPLAPRHQTNRLSFQVAHYSITLAHITIHDFDIWICQAHPRADVLGA